MKINRRPHLHQFEAWNEQFILDIYESRVYKINNLVVRIVDLLREGHPPRKIIENLGSQFPPERIAKNLTALKEKGLLSSSVDKEKKGFTAPGTQPLDTLGLHISHRCNLNCRYCYAKGGNFGREDKLMSGETAKKAIDFFLEHTNGKKKLSIIFDGGEPLLNLDVIKDAVLYAGREGEEQNKTVSLGIGTNATLVTGEAAEFFSKHKVSPQISFDGSEYTHNRLRPFRNGKGSYRAMMQGVEIFKSKGVKLASRITITPGNLKLKDTVEFLHNLGVIRIAAFPATGIPGAYAFGPAELESLKKEYDKTAEFFLDTLFNTGKYVCFSNFTDNLKNLNRAQIRRYGCGAARTFVVIDPYEGIYPCHRMVGNEKYCLGNLKKGIDREKRRLFLVNHVDNREKCRDCWAKYLCGGGCLVEADYVNGDIKIPYDLTCEVFKYEQKLSMMIYAKIHARDKSLLRRIP